MIAGPRSTVPGNFVARKMEFGRQKDYYYAVEGIRKKLTKDGEVGNDS